MRSDGAIATARSSRVVLASRAVGRRARALEAPQRASIERTPAWKLGAQLNRPLTGHRPRTPRSRSGSRSTPRTTTGHAIRRARA